MVSPKAIPHCNPQLEGISNYGVSPQRVRSLYTTSDTPTLRTHTREIAPQTSGFENQQGSLPGDAKCCRELRFCS